MKVRAGGKVVGDLIGDTLVKNVSDRHYFRAFDGFGVAQWQALDHRIRRFRLNYKGRVYKATAKDFIERGVPYHHPDYEPQFILGLRHFTVVDKQQTSLLEEVS